MAGVGIRHIVTDSNCFVGGNIVSMRWDEEAVDEAPGSLPVKSGVGLGTRDSRLTNNVIATVMLKSITSTTTRRLLCSVLLMSLFTAAIKRYSLSSITRPLTKVHVLTPRLSYLGVRELTLNSHYLYLPAPCISNRSPCVRAP
jgi:hypothetical protein